MDKVSIDLVSLGEIITKAVKLDAVLRYIDICKGSPDKDIIYAITDHDPPQEESDLCLDLQESIKI